MGAVTDHLLEKNAALTRLVLEAFTAMDEDYQARVVELLRGPGLAEDFRACRGEYANRKQPHTGRVAYQRKRAS